MALNKPPNASGNQVGVVSLNSRGSWAIWGSIRCGFYPDENFALIDPIIHHSPLAGFVAENHALGREFLVLERGPEKNALVTAVRRSGELSRKGRADERTGKHLAERRATAFHRADELFLRRSRPQSRRFRFVGVLIISGVDQRQPREGRLARLFFANALFSERFGDRMMEGATLKQKKEQNETAPHFSRFNEWKAVPQSKNTGCLLDSGLSRSGAFAEANATFCLWGLGGTAEAKGTAQFRYNRSSSINYEKPAPKFENILGDREIVGPVGSAVTGGRYFLVSKSGRYWARFSSFSFSTGTNRRAAEFMQ